MRLEIFSLLVLAIVYVSAQSAIEPSKKDERLFVGTGSFSFTTFTLLKATTTTTSTLTSTTTCTTSTTTLSTCTPSGGRRRRGLFYNADDKQGRARRGLFYDEEEAEQMDGSIFLPVAPVDNKSSDPVKEVPSKVVSEDSVIPLEVQPGLSGDVLPADFDSSRFLLAFGTRTITSFTISTTTSSLIAICSSTTGFAICASGK